MNRSILKNFLALVDMQLLELPRCNLNTPFHPAFPPAPPLAEGRQKQKKEISPDWKI